MYHATIYGTIGVDALAADLVKVLEAFTKDGDEQQVTVRLNSGGGITSEALAMYHALRDWPGKVDVFVEGCCAGPAMLVAAAGEGITMAPESWLCIAEPMASAFDFARHLVKQAEEFSAAVSEMTAIMAARWPHVPDMAAVMDREVWLSAGEAVAKRWATSLLRDPGVPPAKAANFPYARMYKIPPVSFFLETHEQLSTPKWTERV